MKYNIERIKYHPAQGNTNLIERYRAINEACVQLAEVLMRVLPDSPDSTNAFRQLELTRMCANLSVANEGRPIHIQD